MKTHVGKANNALDGNYMAGQTEPESGTLPVNRYGDIVVADGVPEGLVHVKQPRLGPTCRRLGIEYASAVVGWNGRNYPEFSGIVIRAADHPVLEEALAEKAIKRRQQGD